MASAVYLLPALTTRPHSVPSTPVTAAIVSLGVICTALAFASFFLLIREVGAERAVVITYVAPAVAVAAGVTMLSEPLDARIAVSFVLILCGSRTWLLVARRPHRRLLSRLHTRSDAEWPHPRVSNSVDSPAKKEDGRKCITRALAN